MRLNDSERNWLNRANEQLDGFEAEARTKLAALALPPAGNQAAQRREMRRRARVKNLAEYLNGCVQQAALTREALIAHPQAAKAVYHALMTGMFAHYPDTADVRDTRVTRKEGADTANHNRRFNKTLQNSR
jgi:hypothetical protein